MKKHLKSSKNIVTKPALKNGWFQGKNSMYYKKSKVEKCHVYGALERCPLTGAVVVGSVKEQNLNFIRSLFND
jgi:hypothetical protein